MVCIISITKGIGEMKRKHKIFLTAVLTGVLLVCAGCVRIMTYTAVDTVMGTVSSQTIYSRGEEDCFTSEVKDLIVGLERDTLSWRVEGSEVARINAAAGSGAGVPVSERLYADLEVLLKLSEDSGGAFDITIRPVAELWNIDGWAAEEDISGKQPVSIPTGEQIARALSYTGYEKVLLEDGAVALPEGMALDLGAAGKGIACDRAALYLQSKYVQGAVVSVGGSVVTIGRKPDGTQWQIGIVDPRDTSAFIGILYLEGTHFVSTSGDYERYVEVDGVRYHHILNPATGYPAESGARSVTLLCDSRILSDAPSTACFVLGEEKGMALAEAYGAEALFVDTEGNISMTEGMKQFFQER